MSVEPPLKLTTAARIAAVVALLILIGLNVAGTARGVSHSTFLGDNDSCYYLAAARDLAEGRAEAVLWHHLVTYPEVHHPAFDHWQPGTSLVVAALIPVMGDPMRAAKVAVVLVPTLLLAAALAWLVLVTTREPLAGLCAVVLLLSSRAVDPYRLDLDSVLFGGAFLTLALALHLRGAMATDRRARVALAAGAGALVGAAALTRGDALVVALVLLPVLAWVPTRLGALPRLGALVAGFSVVYGPWVIRNLVAFGHPASPGGRLSLALENYWHLYHFGPHDGDLLADPGLMLSIRWALLDRVWDGLTGYPVGGVALLAAVAASAIGVALRGRLADDDRRLPLSCALPLVPWIAALFAGAVVAPVVTSFSGRALYPYWPAVLGAGVAAATLGIRLLPARSRAAVAMVAVAGVCAFSVGSGPLRLLSFPGHHSPQYAAVAAALPPEALVMTDHPFQLYVDHPAGVVMTPYNGRAGIEGALSHYRPDVLVIFSPELAADANMHADDTLGAIYRGEIQALSADVSFTEVTEIQGARVFEIRYSQR